MNALLFLVPRMALIAILTKLVAVMRRKEVDPRGEIQVQAKLVLLQGWVIQQALSILVASV